MKDYCGYFKRKKITVMGLGLLGRGISDIAYLAECGADLIVTDMKTELELTTSLTQLKSYDISYDLGEHKLENFRDRDMILKAAGVPLESPYIKEARKNNISVEMSSALVALLSGAHIVGVTGTRGKTTTTVLIYEILKAAGKKVYLGGNVRGAVTLPLLAEVRAGDIVVMELDSWQLQGFGESKISADIAIWTNFLQDHMNYYKDSMQAYFADKENIYRYQKKGDALITTKQSHAAIKQYSKVTPLHEIVVKPVKIDNTALLGDHNKENVACAIEAARILGVNEGMIKQAVESFRGVEGRLQFLKDVDGVKIYNDNNATTPDATIAALRALGNPSAGSGPENIVLIIGGSDKGLSLTLLEKEIPKYCKAVILLDGTGTAQLKVKSLKREAVVEVKSLKEALAGAIGIAKSGDYILFSPAFASFGMFKNEYDRNDQWVQLVNEYGA